MRTQLAVTDRYPGLSAVSALPEWLTVALPRGADDCYALFCDLERIPEWLSVIRSVSVTSRDGRGRPRDVAFLARLERGTVGYTLTYRIREAERWLCWATAETSSICIAGFAQFSPLGPDACLMSYSVAMDLGGLHRWSDPGFDANATSAVMADFRDFVSRCR